MNRIITSIKVSSLSVIFATTLVCASPVQKSAANSGVSTSSLEKLKKYDDAWKVLDNPTVVQNMNAVMGNKYSQFKERIQTMNEVEVNGDEISSQGGVEGLYTIMEGAFDLNTKTGRVQVAVHGANTGEASGVLINNKGTYAGEGFKFTFYYRGNVIDVEQSGSGFGGLNVHADGTYKKTDDKVPVINADN